MKYKKYTVLLSSFIVILALSGCGRLNDYVSGAVKSSSDSEIQSSKEYQLYQQYQAEGLLDSDGLYPTPVPDDLRYVRVTIASNSFLNCDYYTNPEAKMPILQSEIYLAPGESIYVEDVSENNSPSNLYAFSCFRIWSYDQEGQRSANFQEVSTESGLLLTIPERFTGSGFSIEPIGSYASRNISVCAYYLENGEKRDIPSGQWTVNGKPLSEMSSISPVDSYTIVYNYNAYQDSFYFVKSEPTCWYSSERNNSVTFREVFSNEPTASFAVEMHPYITMDVTNNCLNLTANTPFIGDHGEGILQSIKLKRGDEDLLQENGDKKAFSISKLKAGDEIIFRVGKDYKITGTGVSVGTAIPLGSNGYEYKIEVPDTNKGISIEIAERSSNAEGTYQGYNLANVDIYIYRANGTELKKGEELPADDEKVTLTIMPHTGYYIDGFTEKDDFSFVKNNIKFAKLEDEIPSLLSNHPAVPFVSFDLVFSDETGTYTYKLDGESVTESPVINVRIGQTLKVEFKANKGFSITHSWFGANAVSNIWTWAGGTDAISESIAVNPDMNGSVVDRETFGIVVKRVG